MYVHSYIYYELDKNIVSDAKWSKWAKELADLQKQYPKESAEVEYADDFKDWDGSSGAFLNFPEFTSTVAHHLLKMREKPIKKVIETPKKKKESGSRKLF